MEFVAKDALTDVFANEALSTNEAVSAYEALVAMNEKLDVFENEALTDVLANEDVSA
jgi:hypothetical protein